MKPLIVLPLLLLAAPQDEVTIAFAPTEGQLTKHQLELRFLIGGAIEANATAVLESTPTRVTDDEVEMKAEFKDFKLDVGGSDPGSEVQPLTFTLSRPDGRLKKVTGGIEGADATRIQALLAVGFPTGPIKLNEPYTVEQPANAEAGVPAFTFTGKYTGKETVEGREGYKIDTTLKEKDGTFTADGTVVITKDGLILRLDQNFKELPIPAVGQNANGSIKATFKP